MMKPSAAEPFAEPAEKGSDVVMTERRSKPRERVDKYFSVEFILGGTEAIYQFRIWNLSPQGMCILVRGDSDLLHHLEVGQIWNMKYYRDDASKPADYLSTQIRHITRDETGRFKNHFLVGLCLLEGPPLS